MLHCPFLLPSLPQNPPLTPSNISMSACRALSKLHLGFCASSSSALSEDGSGQSISIPIFDTPEEDGNRSRLLTRQKKRKRVRIAGVDQENLVDPWLLADPDSRFAEFHGVQIHYKIAHPDDDGTAAGRATSKRTSSTSAEASSSIVATSPAILLHGFGASVFSWERVLQPLAKLLRSKVIAFDRPAFGLTSRVNLPLARPSGKAAETSSQLNPYSVGFSSAATTAFIDFLQSSKAILIGHSAGCIIAADVCLKFPDRVEALIMVAPAIMAPLVMQQQQLRNVDEGMKGRSSAGNDKEGEQSLGNWLSRLCEVVLWVANKVVTAFLRIKEVAKALWCNLLVAILHSYFAIWLLRTIMDRCSLRAVHSAWCDSDKVDDYVIEGYTKPLRCRDWEQALLEYIATLVADPNAGKEKALSQRLGEILCPVLVVTGDKDRLVPSWNSEQLAKALPRVQFKVIMNCGHLPHEEKPDEFLSIVEDFIKWLQQKPEVGTAPIESPMWMAA